MDATRAQVLSAGKEAAVWEGLGSECLFRWSGDQQTACRAKQTSWSACCVRHQMEQGCRPPEAWRGEDARQQCSGPSMMLKDKGRTGMGPRVSAAALRMLGTPAAWRTTQRQEAASVLLLLLRGGRRWEYGGGSTGSWNMEEGNTSPSTFG